MENANYTIVIVMLFFFDYIHSKMIKIVYAFFSIIKSIPQITKYIFKEHYYFIAKMILVRLLSSNLCFYSPLYALFFHCFKV